MAISITKQLRVSPNWKADGSAALTNTLTMIPDALANALLMGVNPVFGLHALMVGTPLGALFSGSEFMTINATGAIAVVMAGVLAEFSPAQQVPALVTLTVLVGPLAILTVLVFGGILEQFPLPAIAALLVVAGLKSFKVKNCQDVWFTGWVPRCVMLVTFVATLLLPIQQAVLLGIGLSILLHIYQSSLDVQVKQILPTATGDSLQEYPAPAHLPANAIILLNIYGSVFYASADIVQAALPSPSTADQTVVILGLRGRSELGSTFINLLERYAKELLNHNSKLILAGVDPVVMKQLTKTRVSETIPPTDIFPVTNILGESLRHAQAAAEEWFSR